MVLLPPMLYLPPLSSLSLSVVCCRPPPALAHLHGDAPNQVRMCASTDRPTAHGKGQQRRRRPGTYPIMGEGGVAFFYLVLFPREKRKFLFAKSENLTGGVAAAFCALGNAAISITPPPPLLLPEKKSLSHRWGGSEE